MITSSRKKPGVAFWAAVVVVMLLAAYPLSSGPAAWLRVHVLPKSTRKAMDTFYWPLAVINRHVPGANALSIRYTLLWVSLDDIMSTVADP